MPRNLNRRVEILFPLKDPDLLRHVRDGILAEYLTDNVKARRMMPDGSYKRVPRSEGQAPHNSQESLLGMAPKQPRRKVRLTW